MRWVLQVLVACLVLLVLVPARGGLPRTPVTAGLDDALVNLDGAIQTLQHARPSRDRERALEQLSMARARLLDAMTMLGSMYAAPLPAPDRDPLPPPVSRPLPAGPLPMGPGAFHELVNDLKELPFSKDQLALLRDAGRHHYFLTEQVRQVLAVFDFGKDKVDAAATLYPRTLDHDDFYKVLKELEFESDRSELRNRIRETDHSGLPAGF